MRRLIAILLTLFAVATLSGCGGDKDKGIEKDKDRPRSEDRDR